MKRKIILFLSALCSLLTLVGCHEVEPEVKDRPSMDYSVKPINIVLTKGESKYIPDVNKFAFDLFAVVQDGKSNSVLSPFSASVALALTGMGARNNTAVEICRALGFETSDVELVGAFYNRMIKGLAEADKYTDVSIANAIWVNERYAPFLKDDFVLKADQYFHSPVKSAPFTNQTLGEINQWVSESTRGSIPKYLDALDPDIVVSLFNAVWFNGIWRTAFTSESKESFTCINGVRKKVDMMQADEISLDYYFADGVAMMKLPYGAGAYSMYVAWNVDKNSLSPAPLTHDLFESLLQEPRHLSKIKLNFPSFSIDGDYDLAKSLKALGIKDAFSSDADFSGIGELGLYISTVLQRAHIEVSMSGTAATGATDVVLGEWANENMQEILSPMSITIDRPFTFLIREESTGVILFIGQKVTF